MRGVCLKMVYELACRDERVVFIGSDLGFGTLVEFRDKFPDRFFMEGISEANLIGMAAGMASEGYVVYVNTIATFLTRRCYEQVALDLGHGNLNVRLIANGGGLVYAPLGPTHQAIDDIALMRAIPNMTIVAPADADEMRRFMPLSLDHRGPMYIRLAKGFDPIVTDDGMGFQIGKAASARTGGDALILTTGIGLRIAREAAERLGAQGIEVEIVHLPTVKPMDEDAILAAIMRHHVLVTVEEHTRMGGLGSAIAEILAEANLDVPRRFQRIALPDKFPDVYGSQASQLEHFGVSASAVVNAIGRLRGADSPVRQPAIG